MESTTTIGLGGSVLDAIDIVAGRLPTEQDLFTDGETTDPRKRIVVVAVSVLNEPHRTSKEVLLSHEQVAPDPSKSRVSGAKTSSHKFSAVIWSPGAER